MCKVMEDMRNESAERRSVEIAKGTHWDGSLCSVFSFHLMAFHIGGNHKEMPDDQGAVSTQRTVPCAFFKYEIITETKVADGIDQI